LIAEVRTPIAGLTVASASFAPKRRRLLQRSCLTTRAASPKLTSSRRTLVVVTGTWQPWKQVAMEHTAALADAITSAFSAGELTRLVYHTFRVELKDVADVHQPYPDVVYDLLRWCDRKDHLGELTLAAYEDNNRNPKLRAVVTQLKPSVAPYQARELDLQGWRRLRADTDEQLESIVLKNVAFQDVRVWLERLGRLFRSVCRVEPQPQHVSKADFGSAFLVAANIVMTNHHVVRGFLDKDPKQVVFRFDYAMDAKGVTLSEGRTTGLAQDWDVLRNDKLDFALVQLAEPVAADGDGRVLVPLTTSPIANLDPLLVLQHPDALPLKLSLGSITEAARLNGRLGHNANTLGGASGSPCLTTNLDAFAIHHAGNAAGNEAVRFDAILEYLAAPEHKARLEGAGLANLVR
jgi:hypothetical protein